MVRRISVYANYNYDYLFCFLIDAGGAAPNETEDVPTPGRSLGRGDLADGNVFLSSTCHLPNLGALSDQVMIICLSVIDILIMIPPDKATLG